MCICVKNKNPTYSTINYIMPVTDITQQILGGFPHNPEQAPSLKNKAGGDETFMGAKTPIFSDQAYCLRSRL